MKNNLTSSLRGSSQFGASIQASTDLSLKAVISESMGLKGSIGTMNLYDYYTKEEIKEIFGNVVTMRKASYFDFPNVGSDGTFYVDVGAGSTYIWDTDTNTYVCIGKDYEKIQTINGGNANE